MNSSYAEKPAMLLSGSLIIPGSGQILFSHPVRGSAFLGFEAVFGSMAYYENLNKTQSFKTLWQNTQDSISDIGNLIQATTDTNHLGNLEKKMESLQRAEVIREGDYKNSQELRNMSLFWAGGLYVYNLMDAFELGIREHHPVTGEKSPKIAVICSMLFPGGGQLYNSAYGKAGMIWMAQTACIASAIYRHQLMNYYEQNLDQANAMTIADSTDDIGIQEFDTQKNYLNGRFNDFRRARNSFIWYSIGIYFYNIFDALVDSHLHSFNDHLEISFLGNPKEEKIQFIGRIKI